MPYPPPTPENLLMEQFIKAMPKDITWSIRDAGDGEFLAVCEDKEYLTPNFFTAVRWIAGQAGISQSFF